MTASLSGVFNLQMLTDTGELAAGYRLYTFAPATTTQKTAYTDAAATVPHTYTSDGIGGQFIGLNARGELPAPLFLTAGGYDIALKTPAGATVWTRRAESLDDGGATFSADLANNTDAAKGSSLVGYLPAGAGAVGRTVQDKLRDVVCVFDFMTPAEVTDVKAGTMALDVTAAIQAAMDAAKLVTFPAGAYKYSRLEFRHDNCVIVGEGQKATYLVSTATGGGTIWNPDQATVTRYYCGVERMQISSPDITANGSILDWRSIQFGTCKRVWLFGNGYAGLAGVDLGAITWTITECTYNSFEDVYIGTVSYGMKFFDGANTNTFKNIRVQPGASKYGFHLGFATAVGRISNNVFVSCHCEFPGGTVTGYALGMGSDGTTIVGARLEGLSTGILITADAINTTLLGNYYDSNTTDISNASTSVARVEKGAFKTDSIVDYGFDFSSYAFNSKRNRFLQASGGFESWLNNAGSGLTLGLYSSTYGGGSVFDVGANGGHMGYVGGKFTIGTTGAFEFGLGVNGLQTQAVDTSGNFVPSVTNAVSCGKSGKLWTSIWATNATIQTSDVNAKTDIQPVDLGLAFIKALRPVTYKMKIGQNIVTRVENGTGPDGEPLYTEVVTPRAGVRRHYGLIAQEVKAVLDAQIPGQDASFWVQDSDTSLQGLRYESLVTPLIKAIQELDARLTAGGL